MWGLHQRLGTIVFLTAFSDDPQAVVFEVFESVCTALNKFHLPVEAFGDAIVFGEHPHTGDGLIPIGQGFGESFQWFEAAIFEGFNLFEELRDELSCLASS